MTYTTRQIKILEALKKANLSPTTLRWLLELVLDSASRTPPSARGHPVVQHSRKTGLSVATRSLHLEAARVLELEADPEVVAYFTEVGRMHVLNPESTGGGKHRLHQPDIVVVYKNSVVLEVCKRTADIRGEMKKPDEQWKWGRDENGEFIFPPLMVSIALLKVDASVRVITEEHVSQRLTDNLNHLASYLQADPTPAQMKETEPVVDAVTKRQGCTIDALIVACGGSVDAVYRAIAHRVVFVDMRRVSVRDKAHCAVYSTAEIATLHASVASNTAVPKHAIPSGFRRPLRIGMTVSVHGVAAEILFVGRDDVTLRVSEGEATGDVARLPRAEIEAALPAEAPADTLQDLQAKVAEIWTRAGEHAMAIARGRAKLILQMAETEGVRLGFELFVADDEECISAGNPSNRSVKRWMASARRAAQESGCALAGLVPAIRQRGNRGDHFDRGLQAFVMDAFAELQQPDKIPQAQTESAKYDYILQKMERNGVKGPTGLPQISYALYKKFRKRFGESRITMAAEGLAARNQLQPAAERLEYTTPIHGTHFLNRGHIDHSPLSVAQVCALIGNEAGRQLFLDTPWLSVMVDAYSRKVLAFTVSFRAPSWITVATLLRICVQRHGQLPTVLVLDNAPEFRCRAMVQLCEWAHVKIIYRRLKDPRSGSIVERLFGCTESQVAANLPGSTRLRTKNFFYSGDMPPSEHARLCLEATAIVFTEFFGRVYDSKIHAALRVSPEQMRIASLASDGKRPERAITDLATFRVLTMLRPRNEAGTAKIQRKYGIQVSGYRYTDKCHLLYTDENEGSSVPVRIDPDDRSVLYALVIGPGGRRIWIRAHCPQLEENDFLPEVSRRFADEIAQNIALARHLRHKSGRRAIMNFVAEFKRVPDTIEELARTLADARVREILLGAPEAVEPAAVATTNLPDAPTPTARERRAEEQCDEVHLD